MKNRNYSDLRRLLDFNQRFEYLKMKNDVGVSTFGFDRYLNQKFYKSREWASVRDSVIARDNGCDLGLKNHPINGHIIVHHMNPVSIEDIIEFKDILINSEYLISVSHNTHLAIHYGTSNLLHDPLIIRKPNDTIPWKKGGN